MLSQLTQKEKCIASLLTSPNWHCALLNVTGAWVKNGLPFFLGKYFISIDVPGQTVKLRFFSVPWYPVLTVFMCEETCLFWKKLSNMVIVPETGMKPFFSQCLAKIWGLISSLRIHTTFASIYSLITRFYICDHCRCFKST